MTVGVEGVHDAEGESAACGPQGRSVEPVRQAQPAAAWFAGEADPIGARVGVATGHFDEVLRERSAALTDGRAAGNSHNPPAAATHPLSR
jgi:hypothetical protein